MRRLKGVVCLLLLAGAEGGRGVVTRRNAGKDGKNGNFDHEDMNATQLIMGGSKATYDDEYYDYYDDDEVDVVGKVLVGGAVAAAVWGGERLWRNRESWLGPKLAALRQRFAGRFAGQSTDEAPKPRGVAAADEGSLDEALFRTVAAEAEAEAESVVEVAAVTEAEAEAEAVVEAVVAADAEVEVEVETVADVAEVEAEAVVEADAEAAAEVEVEIEAENAEIEAEAEVEAETEAETEAEVEAEVEAAPKDSTAEGAEGVSTSVAVEA